MISLVNLLCPGLFKRRLKIIIKSISRPYLEIGCPNFSLNISLVEYEKFLVLRRAVLISFFRANDGFKWH